MEASSNQNQMEVTMGMMIDGTPTYDWWVRDRHGHRWDLYGDVQGTDGVVLEKIEDAETSIDRTMSATSHQIGERVSGRSFPALHPKLTVSISTRRYPKAFIDWKSAWSQDETDPCELYCVSPHTGEAKKLVVSQASGAPAPEGDPQLLGLIIQELELLALGGVWTGMPVELKAGQSWVNDGDIPPLITYHPTGAGSIRLGVGEDEWSASHSAVFAGAAVDLDPEEMMKTRFNDEVRPALWSQWRNHWNPLVIGAGKTLKISAASGVITVTPRYLTPW